jgi:hypothetical protein
MTRKAAAFEGHIKKGVCVYLTVWTKIVFSIRFMCVCMCVWFI